MSLFPLPLTSLEEYLFCDNFRGYPHTLSGRFRFRGRLDPEMAEEALRRTRQRHPMVNCRVTQERKRLYWEPLPIEHCRFELVARDSVNGLPHLSGIDLRTEAGGQMIIVHDDDSCDVIVHGHHACVDGVGALQLFLDWMTIYHQLSVNPKSEPRLRRLEPEALRRRGAFGFGSWDYVKKLHKQAIGLFGVYEFLTHNAVSLVPNSLGDVESDPPEPYPGVVSVAWEPSEYQAHRELAEQWKTTSNELVLAGLLKALSHWRRDKGYGAEGDWLRIMVPFNMRRFEHRALPATNRVSFISIDRRARPFNRFAEFAQGINSQMRIIHDNDLDLIFLGMLNFYRRLPGGLRGLANPKRCGATAILTNLGEPFRRARLPRQDGNLVAGQLVLEGCDMLPPLRPNTNIAFSAFRYNQRQCLTAAFDRRVLSEQDARDLLTRLTRFSVGKK